MRTFLETYGGAIAIVFIVFAVLFGIISLGTGEEKRDSFGGFSVDRVDAIGTNASPIDFSFSPATSTAYINTGGTTDVLDLHFKAVAASGSPIVNFYVEKSSDSNCTVSNSAWFDASSPLPSAGATDLGTGTTTYSWTPGGPGEGKTLQFKDWNAKCAKVVLGSASTTMWLEALLKELR